MCLLGSSSQLLALDVIASNGFGNREVQVSSRRQHFEFLFIVLNLMSGNGSYICRFRLICMIGCRPATAPSTSSSSSSAFNDIDGSELEEGLADFDSFRAFEQRQWGRAGVTKPMSTWQRRLRGAWNEARHSDRQTPNVLKWVYPNSSRWLE